MKKRLFLVVMATMILLTGCKEKPNIYGEWQLTKFMMGTIDVFNSKVLSSFIDDCMKTNTYLLFYSDESNNDKFELRACDQTEVTGNYTYEDGICVFTNVQSDNSMYKFPNGVVEDNSVMTITMPIKDLDFVKELPSVVQGYIDTTANLVYTFNRILPD
ncbi:MAG: hypothetical protein ACI3ZZ_05615 [Candidatus Aphodosoma sp.]